MAGVPHRFQPDTPYPETVAQLNDNFDKVVQDVGDLGAKFSSVGFLSATVPSNGLFYFSVGVTDPKSQYIAGRLQIVPRIDVFVDVDNDDDHLLGLVNPLTAGQQSAMVSIRPAKTPALGTVATFLVNLLNLDANPHTYYFYVDESYMQSPVAGQFR